MRKFIYVLFIALLFSTQVVAAPFLIPSLTVTTPNPSIQYQASGNGSVARTLLSKLTDHVNVMDYAGCDPTGAADSTACIQAAIAANPNSVIDFPPGTFKVTSATTIQSATILKGSGTGSTIINVAGTGYDALTFTLSGSGVMDMQFTSPTARASGYYLNFATTGTTAIQQNIAKNLFIQNGNGIDISGPNTTLTYILDSNFYGSPQGTGIGIWIEGGAGTVISNVQMDNPNASQPSAGILMTGGGGVLISKTDVVHSGIGLNVIP
ncbi:glycosyl hydrolase family 28-related protein [Acidovorax sp. 16-64-162]|uniref:glycosyl hydrolase family 28-related protein n=1 Tax=Acidovorax sp. 16-64-162 TaxID=1970307 RepID=UPI0025C5460F|nr:glycosyl hydrolase family 28-related protein [Acidovorax sp. 16-64-162]